MSLHCLSSCGRHTLYLLSLPLLQDQDDDFLACVCRHFAMLFHLQVVPSSGITSPSLSPSAAKTSASEAGEAAATAGDEAGAGSDAQQQQAARHALRVIDPVVFLDAVVEVLGSNQPSQGKCGLQALAFFLEALLLMAQARLTAASASPAANTTAAAAAAGAGAAKVPGIHAAVTAVAKSPGTPVLVHSPSTAGMMVPPTLPGVSLPVVDELLVRLLHACYGMTWQVQMGGVMGIGLLVARVPASMIAPFQVRLVAECRLGIWRATSCGTAAFSTGRDTSEPTTGCTHVWMHVIVTLPGYQVSFDIRIAFSCLVAYPARWEQCIPRRWMHVCKCVSVPRMHCCG